MTLRTFTLFTSLVSCAFFCSYAVRSYAQTSPSPDKPVERKFSTDTLYSLLTAEIAGSRQQYDVALTQYAQQANKAPLSFLLSGLNIVSTCDQHFKSSKNQRLHVELALMKLAYLNAAVNFATNGVAEGAGKKLMPVA